MFSLNYGLLLIFSVLTLPVLVVIYVATLYPTKNILVKSLSRSSLGLIIPAYVFLGYLAFSSHFSKNELENQVELIPYSKFKNLKPLWLFSQDKTWSYSNNKSARSAMYYYENKKNLKDFKFNSKCGLNCLEYLNKENNKKLTIKISSLGKKAYIEYHINNNLL